LKTILKAAHVLDYVVAIGTIGYGVYERNPLYIGLGVAGIALARANIADLMSARLRKYLMRKVPPTFAPLAEDSPTVIAALVQVTRSYGNSGLTAGVLNATPSRHNLLGNKADGSHGSVHVDWV
jgi:hypothetical protein